MDQLIKNHCDKVVLVMRDHYAQSEIIRWVLEENYRKTEMVFKDYMIWSATKDLP
jgi:3-methyladenine DNA glycosylase AlkC